MYSVGLCFQLNWLVVSPFARFLKQDMSGATEAFAMFRGARQFNQDLSAWVGLALLSMHNACPYILSFHLPPFSLHRMSAAFFSLASCLEIVRDLIAIYPTGTWDRLLP